MTRISALRDDIPDLDEERPAVDSREQRAGRLIFIDVLRVAVIALVIAHHAAQPYGPTGGDWPVEDPGNIDWLGSFFAVNAAFFMGLLFLLAGYFVPRSYDRRGTGGFMMGRWKRIGLPLAFFALFIHVPLVYLLDEDSDSFGGFIANAYKNGWQEVYLHLWFLGHLLLYSALYVAWRRWADRRPGSEQRALPVPGHLAFLGFAAGLALLTWVVRFWWPIDEWTPLLFVLAAEPAHLVQYVSLFAVGIMAYRGDWLRKLRTTTGLTWLVIGVGGAAGGYALRALSRDTWDDLFTTGGTDFRSLVYSAWEAVICVGLCVGLIVLFRQVFTRENRLLAAMATASYAAYILHLLMVVGLQSGFEGTDVPVLAKFGLVTLLSVILAFGLGYLSRRIPGLRVVLGTQPEGQRTP
jgi:peptidoglycan/LPS O-acetylase OafA/YrhL